LNLGVLYHYRRMLCDCDDEITLPDTTGRGSSTWTFVCWTLSNILTGPIEHKLQVLEHGFFPILIGILKTEPFFVHKEALWALVNAMENPDERVIKHLIQIGIIPALCGFLLKAHPAIKNILITCQQIASKGRLTECADIFDDMDGMENLICLLDNGKTDPEILNEFRALFKELHGLSMN